MTIENILQKFDDYELESGEDSISIEKLKEVLPNMIECVIRQRVSEFNKWRGHENSNLYQEFLNEKLKQ